MVLRSCLYGVHSLLEASRHPDARGDRRKATINELKALRKIGDEYGFTRSLPPIAKPIPVLYMYRCVVASEMTGDLDQSGHPLIEETFESCAAFETARLKAVFNR